MNKNLIENTHGKHYNKVWSSKLLALIWLGNIINVIYVHFWLPKTEKKRFCEIPSRKIIVYSNVVLDELRQSIGLSFLAKTREVNLWKLLTGIPLGPWQYQDLWFTRNYVNNKLEVVCCKTIRDKYENNWMSIQKTIKICGWQTFHTMTKEKKQ